MLQSVYSLRHTIVFRGAHSPQRRPEFTGHESPNRRSLRGYLAMTRLNFHPKQSVRSPLETYLWEIKRTPLLNAEDEKQLAFRIEEGRNDAREQMVRANLRLVVSIARSY